MALIRASSRSCFEQVEVVGVGADVLFGGGAEDAGAAGVGVLDVEDGVAAGVFGACGVEVEVHLGVGGALEEKETGGVGADFFDEFAEGDEFAGAFGHAHALPAAAEVDELVEQHFGGGRRRRRRR